MSTLRFDWYQSGKSVIIDLFVKNLKPEDLSIVFDEQLVSVSINREESILEREFILFESIKTAESYFRIGKNKVEVVLIKLDESKTWDNLELGTAVSDKITAPPKYPSSARKPIDPEIIKDTEVDPEPTGDAAINSLFQKIYANANEDTKRAMMKSFIESKGTVLSTNWDEVGERAIEPVPPKNN